MLDYIELLDNGMPQVTEEWKESCKRAIIPKVSKSYSMVPVYVEMFEAHKFSL